ncbi:MAG: Tex family protein [Bacteroidota bacterium]
MNENHIQLISNTQGIQSWQVKNTLDLFESGCTLPFVARYRKEKTGNLDEVEIQKIRQQHQKLVELDDRREAVIKSIEEQEKMTPELLKQINNAATLPELEDLYLPYKQKKKTRASVAKARGLEPLADLIFNQESQNVSDEAKKFVNAEKEVPSLEDALAGARDIIAERISEHADARARMRMLYQREAEIVSKVSKGKEKEGEVYSNYFEWKEIASKSPSHRILAMFRGEKEKMLKVQVSPASEHAVQILDRIFIKNNLPCAQQVKLAVEDSYKRLLAPSIENEFREELKNKADAEAIRIFAENLRQLLLQPPLGPKNILGIDPGFRTGCKLVVVDSSGKLIHNETIFPHPPQNDVSKAKSKISHIVDTYHIDAIAIGNGTAGRETESLVKSTRFNRDVKAYVVNEAGASVYSASTLAREEFPDYDVTVRGAVSIGRRLIDPLAELVKIDPKSIGVGQYQHDVDQKELGASLDVVVIGCVNAVGVEVNTASKQLLSYVSGLGPVLAQNIISYREKNGTFISREQLKKVPRLGDKAFEQCAGFLRIRDAKNPLDFTAVHPERYKLVKQMAKDVGCEIGELICNEEKVKTIDKKKYISDEVGLPTLDDITEELLKPGRDPRSKVEFFEFDQSIRKIEDVHSGMLLPGIITNITAFGCFVDIGIHENGLVHISQLADRFVSDPNDVVKLNQKVKVKVLEVDIERKRISLSMKEN